MRRLVFCLLLLGLGCVDVPDVDSPLTFACNTADDCVEDYECGSNGYCQPGPSSSACTSEATTTCVADDMNLWWVDSCGEPHALREFCNSCCSGTEATAQCVDCS